MRHHHPRQKRKGLTWVRQFKTKQIGNSCTCSATPLDQLQALSILMVGAYTVMTEPGFAIGMPG